jgi:hypothetical protein
MGAVIGSAFIWLAPSVGIDAHIAALVGMAAMFAGASRALLTSIVFALETTHQPHGLLPLLGGCVAAYFISFFLMKGSIMTEKIQRRGVKTPDAYEPDILQGVAVSQLLIPVKAGISDAPYIYANDDVGFAAEMMGACQTDTLLVLENKNNRKPAGMITAQAILAFYSQGKQKEHAYDSPGRTKRILVQGRKWFQKI